LTMETREIICILCPVGCKMKVEIRNGEIVRVENAECGRGKDYSAQEVKSPVRDFFTTVRVKGGRMPLVSVRSIKPVPKDMLIPCATELARIMVSAPVRLGDTVFKNMLNLGIDIVATKDVPLANSDSHRQLRKNSRRGILPT